MSQDSTIDYYRQRRKELVERLGGECVECGAINDLQFHHVNPEEGNETGMGGWNHLYAIEEDLENGVEIELLCRECHLNLHNNSENLEEMDHASNDQAES